MLYQLDHLLILFLSIIIISCGGQANQATEAETPKAEEGPLVGKWILKKRKYDPDTTFRIIEEEETYHKILTKHSFVWYRYDQKGGHLLGTAGGTYKLEGESYIEDIHFSHPAGTGILGVSIPFKCTLDGDTWLHSGYIQEREMDEEVGDFVVTATRRLEEVWIKVE